MPTTPDDPANETTGGGPAGEPGDSAIGRPTDGPTDGPVGGSVDGEAVQRFLTGFHDGLCADLERLDGEARFESDAWKRPEGGGGVTRILTDGALFEKAGVAFSRVSGTKLPPSATAARPQLAGRGWEAMGVSLVLHPWNPYVPTTHANVRFFKAEKAGEAPIWWFGGGFDLTPYYGFEEDCVHWHRTARDAVEPFGTGLHDELKAWCDRYFFIEHRGEARGVGGLFFDDFDRGGFDNAFGLMRSVAESFLPAYAPIVERRRGTSHTERERDFQLVRRGRYVEFNLVLDRGTLFGLQSGGRTESILMSMPPKVAWEYRHEPEPGSPEEALTTRFLPVRDWLADG